MDVWKNDLKQCKVVFHTDNDAVRGCFISCHSTSANVAPVLEACMDLELKMAWNAWITRVPTESNIADDPSPFEIRQLLEQQCQSDSIDVAGCWERLVGSVKRRGIRPAEWSGGGPNPKPGIRPAEHSPAVCDRVEAAMTSSQCNGGIAEEDVIMRLSDWLSCEVIGSFLRQFPQKHRVEAARCACRIGVTCLWGWTTSQKQWSLEDLLEVTASINPAGANGGGTRTASPRQVARRQEVVAQPWAAARAPEARAPYVESQRMSSRAQSGRLRAKFIRGRRSKE
eukprot:s2434_g2.t1